MPKPYWQDKSEESPEATQGPESAWDEYLRVMTWHKPAPRYVADLETGHARRAHICQICRDEGTVGIVVRPEDQPMAFACPSCRPQTIPFRRLGLPEKEMQWAVKQGKQKRTIKQQAWLMTWLEKERRKWAEGESLPTETLRGLAANVGKAMPAYKADEPIESGWRCA